jgi:hypothetical protein
MKNFALSLLLTVLVLPTAMRAADHNDPNAVNSIFSDIEPNPADLYDFFGWPSDNPGGEEKVVMALTFASIPRAGTLDPDLLYRILVAPTPRYSPLADAEPTLGTMLKYLSAVTQKYLSLHPAEIRVVPVSATQARIQFSGFIGENISQVIDLNKAVTLNNAIKAYVGGRDDAFFNDLPGFFRSINYAPQFYHIKQSQTDLRELPIPKTLIELEGNDLFNFDSAHPKHGQGEKFDLPPGAPTWNGNAYHKDAQGNFRFVYSGTDAQAGKNVNAIIVEIPLSFLTAHLQQDRIVNAWGESWVRKATGKVPAISDEKPPVLRAFWLEYPVTLPALVIALGILLLLWAVRSVRCRWISRALILAVGVVVAGSGLLAAVLLTKISNQKPDLARSPSELDEELHRYKLVDTDGQPFADAALFLREDNKQLGAYDFDQAFLLIKRLAHLGWGFGPSITALGLKTAFDHSNSPLPVHKEVTSALAAFPRVKKVIFQQLNMPDNSWNKSGKPIPLRRPIEIFIPNVCAIDMDTTGTWPYGRRLEDQVATRFLSLFLDMNAEVGGKKYNIETLANQSLWDSAPIGPKTPPNPLANDKPFLTEFPYLADPWPIP